MDTIRSAIWINAPVERCFLLALSVDLHVASARSLQKAVKGVTTGLIGLGESVTFEGHDLTGDGPHTSVIDELRACTYFREVMVTGNFRYFVHEHHFATMDDGTRMRDEIRFSASWGHLGRVLARRRIKAFLKQRNSVIKRVAESDEWRKYLEDGRVDRPVPPVKGEAAKRWDGNALLHGPHGIVATRR
jgi:hypothetical protein